MEQLLPSLQKHCGQIFWKTDSLQEQATAKLITKLNREDENEEDEEDSNDEDHNNDDDSEVTIDRDVCIA